jgi:WD40 repeat protein
MSRSTEYSLRVWSLLNGYIGVSAMADLVAKYLGLDSRSIKKCQLVKMHLPLDICSIVLEYNSGIMGNREWTEQFDVGPLYNMAVSHEGQVIVGSWAGPLCVWDPACQTITTLTGHTAMAVALLIVDGELVSASADQTILFWNLSTGNCVRKIIAHPSPTSIDECNGKLVEGSYAGMVYVWDIARCECLLALKGHTAGVTSVGAMPKKGENSFLIASGSNDSTVRVWDSGSGACLLVLEGHTNRVTDLTWTSSGNLASCSADRTVRVWNIDNGACMLLEYHSREVACVSTLGDLLVSASFDGTTRIYAKDGSQIHVLEQPKAVCYVVAQPEVIYILNNAQEIQKIQ